MCACRLQTRKAGSAAAEAAAASEHATKTAESALAASSASADEGDSLGRGTDPQSAHAHATRKLIAVRHPAWLAGWLCHSAMPALSLSVWLCDCVSVVLSVALSGSVSRWRR
jgi:hypothetical protein